jgi:ABC-2 type transport system ATP-binding protein
MRGDFAAAMLHEPKVVFLDEPTIGLDVVAKEAIRKFIQRVNEARGTTFLLTTHDLNDIEKLCARIVLIDHGQKLYDGSIEGIRDRFGRKRMLTVELADDCSGIAINLPGVVVVSRDGPTMRFEFDRDVVRADQLITALAAQCELRDITIAEPELETIIRQIYQRGMISLQPEPAVRS